MRLDELLLELKKQSHTLGWGAVMAISQRQINEHLALAYDASMSRLPALSARINLLQDASEFLEAQGLSLGAPQLGLGRQVIGTRVAVRLPLVAGAGVYRQIPGRSASSGKLLTTQSISAEAGYHLDLTAEVKVAIDAFGNRAHLFLDLTTATNASCNLWPYSEGANRIASTLLAHVQGLPRAFSQVPLASVDLNVRDGFSVKDLRLAFQANPETSDDGALLVFMQLNTPDTFGSGLPGPNFPYLIPSDTNAAGEPLYGVTWLVKDELADLLASETSGALPACIRHTTFGDDQVLREGVRHVPKDWAVFGQLKGSGSELAIVPHEAQLVAGQTLRFTLQASDGTPLPGVTWLPPVPHTSQAQAGTIDMAGNFTAPAAASFPADVIEVSLIAQRMVNGQTVQASTVVKIRREAFMQQAPMQVLNLWRDDAKSRTLGALSLDENTLQWALVDTPLAGEAVQADPAQPRLAQYTAPTDLNTPLAVRWVQVGQHNRAAHAGPASRAGLIVVKHEHPLSVEPALAERVMPGSTCRFKVLELSDGVITLADGRTHTVGVNENPWSVIGEGSITEQGVYSPPANPTLPFDVVYFNAAGVLAGYAVVKTGQASAAQNTWSELAKFSLTVDYGNVLYANGGQQVPVKISVMTKPILDPITGTWHVPISPVELASVHLIDKTTRNEVPMLEPFEEGLAEGRLWATRTARNRYDLPQGTQAEASVSPLAEGDVQRTRTRTLYVHTHSTAPLELAAAFIASGGMGGRYESDSAAYEGPTSLTITPQRVLPFDRHAYRFPDGGDEGQSSQLDKPTYWRGREYTGGDGELEQWYSMASDTTTRYSLSLAQPGRTFVSMGLISNPDDSQPAPDELVVNQVRWESEFWGEGGFSYTAAALNGTAPVAGTPGSRYVGLGLPLRRLDAQQRQAGLPIRTPANGPYPDPPKSVPLFDELAGTPPVGSVAVLLERRGDMHYQWPDQAAGDQVKAWQKEMASPLSMRLRDNVGNLHRVAIGFRPENNQTSGRDDLRMVYPAGALPADDGGASGSSNGATTGTAAGTHSKKTPRAPASALHSNAFNFLSFLEGGVDPRTGQYTLQLALPPVQANQLAGPELALRLGFDPFNNVDAGYGLGWALNLSQVDTYGKGRLRLSSGEAYSLNAVGEDNEYTMVERKVPVCRLFRDGAGYRLVHRDGTVEQLEVPGVGDLALPKTILAPTGHRLHFSYSDHEGNARLRCVTDDVGRMLLRIDAIGGEFLDFVFPAEGQADPVTFKAELNARRLERLVLPTQEAASWRLSYRQVNGYTCVAEVQTPAGARETIEYDATGHGVPGDAKPRLPRVALHSVAPGGGQPDQVVRYAYSGENFLGYPSVGAWHEEEDNLYQAAWHFTYWSEATHTGAGEQRRVKRTYNSLHLLQEERTEQEGHVHTVSSEFHWRPGEPFAAQPNQCQLPKKVTTQWRLDGQSAVREEVVETDYDSHGNLVQHTAETGVVTQYTYYPGGHDSDGCPKDPHGFTRYEHTRTVEPSTRFAEPGAATLVTTSTYQQLPALDTSPWPGPVLPHTETLTEAKSAAPVRLDTYTWFADPAQAFTLGRLATQRTVLSGDERLATVQRYAYALGDGEAGGATVLKTDITTEGFDGTQQVKYLEQSTVTGLMLLERDTQGDDENVDIRRRYDALQRVVEETIAPGTPQEASRVFSYRLVDNAGAGAEQTVTDVKGLRLRTQVDGLGRAIAEHRREPGASAEMQTYAARYDGLGQLRQATEWDDFGSQRSAVAMTEHYEYDNWGERCATLGADGVRRVELVDPLGVPNEGVTQVRRTRLESRDGSVISGEEVTYLNAFEQAVKTLRREDQAGRDTHLYEYTYDGLGRKVKEVNPLKQTTQYTYDLFDRDLQTTLPDGAKVKRSYAAHSVEDLPTRIAVVDPAGTEHLLGTQAFDGVGRMIEAVTGGRKRRFSYKHNQTRPETVITPKGITLAYEYQPRLGDQPILRRVGEGAAALAGNEERYEYDPKDARLVRCLRAQQEVLTRSYHSNGRLLSETRQHDGRQQVMHYAYSVQERLLSYTDVTGQQQSYRYDAAHGGRLQASSANGLECTVEYDALGRDSRVTTVDTQARTSLATSLRYDAYGRETERCFQFAQGECETLAQQYDELDRITRKTLTAADGSVLRDETFEYDSRGRLSIYACTGPECPLDPYGNQISAQIFECDALDNHTLVITTWTEQASRRAQQAYRAGRTGKALAEAAGEGMNVALYLFENPEDPVQLTGIVNEGDGGYPPEVALAYDADGNLLNDEWGRSFSYDELGRLVHVEGLAGETPNTYHYDPLDVISARIEAANDAGEGRFYCDGVLHTLLEAGDATVIVRAGDHLLAEQHQSAKENKGQAL
ncbi:hypothetical protein [Pseudomonas sp. RIT-PI-S]|uniref:RHS repeat domain-containing protein n=1 Tax=Pseudomonas sp. RIT-PI-S TaxID=3035295 RepID=UPI0021D9D0FD|nr:hypothetical protein [Pseudomonas sp. RIT-PI-S]